MEAEALTFQGNSLAMKLFVNPAPTPERPRLERGVYILPFLSSDGRQQMVAIDRQGREFDRRLFGSDESADLISTELQQKLDQEDQPYLKIA